MLITTEERIEAINAGFLIQWGLSPDPEFAPVMGTSLSQVLLEQGRGWCLAVGRLQQLKYFFCGPSIEAVLQSAEKFYKVSTAEPEAVTSIETV